jgi:hypothetical protein
LYYNYKYINNTKQQIYFYVVAVMMGQVSGEVDLCLLLIVFLADSSGRVKYYNKEGAREEMTQLYHRDFIDLVSNFNVGDRIRVKWTSKRQGIGKECYISEGNIVQITDNAIYIRGDVGFTAGINKGDIAMGVEIKQIS